MMVLRFKCDNTMQINNGEVNMYDDENPMEITDANANMSTDIAPTTVYIPQ